MVMEEPTLESPPQCTRKTTPSEDTEEEVEVLGVKPGTTELE